MSLMPVPHPPKPRPPIAVVPDVQMDTYVAMRVEGPYEWHNYCNPCSLPILRSTMGDPPRARRYRDLNLYEIYTAPVALQCSTCGKQLSRLED